MIYSPIRLQKNEIIGENKLGSKKPQRLKTSGRKIVDLRTQKVKRKKIGGWKPSGKRLDPTFIPPIIDPKSPRME